MAALYMGQRRRKEKETLMTSKEDIRDNVIHYDDEGGGEADTHAYDMGTLRNTHSQRTSAHSSISKKEKSGYGDGVLMHLSSRCDNVRSPDIHRQTASVIAAVNKAPLPPRGKVTAGNAEMIREFIAQRLEESEQGYAAPPYDSLATYAYEGNGSVAGSLSSIEESWVIDDSGEFSSLGDWAQPFKNLASIMDTQPSTLTEES
ncbi:hypothetical protein PBY51_020975 [Eleginops maclovinus]|nr:hypothetical protein PBY51_020975 [Eleginops maclovinus]